MTIEDNGIDLSNLTDDQVMHYLALRWKARREGQYLKVGTIKHADAQLNFFMGAMQAMELCGRRPPQSALLLLSVGRDAVELWGKADGKP